MNLSSLLRAHVEWVVLLREATYGARWVTATMAEDATACALGSWLDRHQAAYGALPEYAAAVRLHSAFHHRAAYCLELLDAGRRLEAQAEACEGGELRRLSQQLAGALVALKRATLAGERHDAHRPAATTGLSEAFGK